MNLTQFQQQLAQTLQFVEQLSQQNPNQPISALDKDTLAARLRDLYAMLVFDNPQPVSYAQPVVQSPIVQEPAANEVVFETVKPQAENKTATTEKVSFEIVNDEALFETPQVKTQAVIIETPQVETQAVIIETPQVETQAVVVENPQENTLVIVNNAVQTQEPTNENTNTGVVLAAGFSMVAQKNNEVTIRNQAIYDANEAAMRSNSAFRAEYDELFEFKAATELSQKLSETKIEDLNKAMGLNEKFFFINELFGGNSKKFKDCMEFLNNNAKSMEDAREYLEAGLMDEYHWLNPKRKALCKDFLKTVRRRYLK